MTGLFPTAINHEPDIRVVLIRIYNKALWTFTIMMWAAVGPYNTIETNKISGDFVGIPHISRSANAGRRRSPQRLASEQRGAATRGSGLHSPAIGQFTLNANVISTSLTPYIFSPPLASYRLKCHLRSHSRRIRTRRSLAPDARRATYYGNIN